MMHVKRWTSKYPLMGDGQSRDAGSNGAGGGSTVTAVAEQSFAAGGGSGGDPDGSSGSGDSGGSQSRKSIKIRDLECYERLRENDTSQAKYLGQKNKGMAADWMPFTESQLLCHSFSFPLLSH